MKTKINFLKYRNLFKFPTAPGLTYPKIWAKAITKLHNKLGADFIDRDEMLEEDIISLTLELHYSDNLNEKYFSLISNLSNYFECLALCTYTVDRNNPAGSLVKTVQLVGYTQDVKLLYHILSCAINGTDHLRIRLQNRYRSNRIRTRRGGNAKHVKHVPAKTRASNNYYKAIETITSVSVPLLAIRRFGVLHRIKKKLVAEKLQEYYILNYKYPNAIKPKIKHAYTKNKFVKGRIIQS